MVSDDEFEEVNERADVAGGEEGLVATWLGVDGQETGLICGGMMA